METTSPVYRLSALVTSCLIHVGLVAGFVALGLELHASRAPAAVVMAELVASEPPRPVERTEPPPARPAPPVKPKKLTLPKPIATPPVAVPERVEAPERIEPPAAPEKVEAPAPTIPTPQAAPLAGPAPPDRARNERGQSTTVTAFGDIRDTAAPAAPAAPGAPAVEAPAAATSTAMAIPDGITRTAIPRGGYQVRPSYPASARRLGIQGTATLRIYVSADGRVTEITVEQSAGHPDLDHSAADAVRRWRFDPARRGTEAVGMWVLLPVEFRLR